MHRATLLTPAWSKCGVHPCHCGHRWCVCRAEACSSAALSSASVAACACRCSMDAPSFCPMPNTLPGPNRREVHEAPGCPAGSALVCGVPAAGSAPAMRCLGWLQASSGATCELPPGDGHRAARHLHQLLLPVVHPALEGALPLTPRDAAPGGHSRARRLPELGWTAGQPAGWDCR